MTKICLNMIVKNEQGVIERSLRSVLPLIDHWVIVDTGSSDGTQEIIKTVLSHIPGTLYERPWVDFAHNRNEAFILAKDLADYLLFIDADEEWVFSKPFDKKALHQPFYVIKNRDLNVNLHRICLVNTKFPWIWEGVVHEEITSYAPVQGEKLEGVECHGFQRDGARATSKETYLRDIALLEKALEKNPHHPRSTFFLAQSYLAAGNGEKALALYEKRACMQGFTPEVFWSLFLVGCLKHDLRKPQVEVIKAYLQAFLFDSTRAEPLHHLAALYQDRGNFAMAYILTKIALTLPPPTSLCYVLREVYEYSLLLRHACAAHDLKQFDEAKKSYQTLLTLKEAPPEAKRIAKHNLALVENP